MESLSELLEQNSGDPRVRLQLGQRLLQHFALQPLPNNTRLSIAFTTFRISIDRNYVFIDYFEKLLKHCR